MIVDTSEIMGQTAVQLTNLTVNYMDQTVVRSDWFYY